MARIRTIKPEFFTSDDICALSMAARLLYIGAWCEADREGRMEWKPRSLKRRYLPDDNIDIDALCGELINAGLVVLYGDSLAYIPTFAKHQHINPRESVSNLPEPPDHVPESPKRISTDVRSEVMARDGHKCVRCNAVDDLTLDHILPQCIGGTHTKENLRVMCRHCNAARPVSGQGLVDDLALDGLTVEGLRVKLGIDASPRVVTRANQDVHTQGGKEGKEGKETRDASRGDDFPGFAEFWTTWPTSDRKQARGKCLEAWKKARCEGAAAEIVAHVEAMKLSAGWRKNGGEFIPAPLVYLNGRRWEGAELTGADAPTSLGVFV